MPLLAAFAEQLAARRAAARLGQATQADSGSDPLAAKLKKTQLALDVVKGIALGTAAFTGGLDGFSLVTFFIVANGELLATLVLPWFKQQLWRKIAIVTVDLFIIFYVIVSYGFFSLVFEKPDIACEAIGAATLNPLLVGMGYVGGCEALVKGAAVLDVQPYTSK